MTDLVQKIADDYADRYGGETMSAARIRQMAEEIRAALADAGGAVGIVAECLSRSDADVCDARWQVTVLCNDKLKCGTTLYAHPTPDAGRVAELEKKLGEQRRISVELNDQCVDYCRRIAALEAQLAALREREAKLIADLDANLDAYSDERKRALSAENLARELHELLTDYVSQDSIAQGYGSGVGGTTYQKAEAFLDALAADKENTK